MSQKFKMEVAYKIETWESLSLRKFRERRKAKTDP